MRLDVEQQTRWVRAARVAVWLGVVLGGTAVAFAYQEVRSLVPSPASAWPYQVLDGVGAWALVLALFLAFPFSVFSGHAQPARERATTLAVLALLALTTAWLAIEVLGWEWGWEGWRPQRAEARADVGASPLSEKLRALNQCSKDEDCWDLGFVPGLGCHVPVRAALGVEAQAHEAIEGAPEVQRARESCVFERGDSIAPRCRIECPQFFGFECQSARCVARSRKPDRDICTINEAAVDCGEVLDRLSHSTVFDCRRICDGGHEGGARVQFVADGETRDGKRFAERVVIDFLRCTSCRPSR